jgi:hypothetical protein
VGRPPRRKRLKNNGAERACALLDARRMKRFLFLAAVLVATSPLLVACSGDPGGAPELPGGSTSEAFTIPPGVTLFGGFDCTGTPERVTGKGTHRIFQIEDSGSGFGAKSYLQGFEDGYLVGLVPEHFVQGNQCVNTNFIGQSAIAVVLTD